MKLKVTSEKPKTISDICGQPPGSFQRMLEEERRETRRQTKEADERMKREARP